MMLLMYEISFNYVNSMMIKTHYLYHNCIDNIAYLAITHK